MKLTRKKIDELVLIILGEEYLPFIDALYSKEKVSEFTIAEDLELDIKVVRKRLYMLYNHNFVVYDRKKDKVKGWYIYYWTLIPKNIQFAYVQQKRKSLRLLEEKLEREGDELFYVCPNKCVRLSFNEAIDYEFHCPECGELLLQADTQGARERIEERVAKLKEEIAEIESHDAKEREKVRKRLEKERKKEEERIAKEEAEKEAEKVRKAEEKKRKEAEKKAKAAAKKKAAKEKAEKKKAAAAKKKEDAKKKAAKKKVAKKVTKKKVVKKKTAAKKKVTKKKVAKKAVKKKSSIKKKVVKKAPKKKVAKKKKVTKK